MPTATSSREPVRWPDPGPWGRGRRAVRDTGHLLRFRVRITRRPRLLRGVGLGVGAVLAAAAVVPAHLPGAGTPEAAALERFAPAALTGFLVVAVVAAVSTGGGRELLPREQAVALPVSPATDHLGALVLAPLNIAWLLQAAVLAGATAYAVGPAGLLPAQVALVLWLLAATALAQALGWVMEYVRRGPHGVLVVRSAIAAVLAVAAAVQASGATGMLLADGPARFVVPALTGGYDARWTAICALLLVVTVAAAVLGSVPAGWAARRVPRDEQRLESATRAPRGDPRSAFAALVRVDRASVWRVVPIRRGLMLLAVGPAIVGWAGSLAWSEVVLMVGMVVSGSLLLFGVNAWSLDRRGMLWRESLPVAPSTVFHARSWVVAECLLLVAVVAVVLGGVAGGTPAAVEAAALAAAVLVVVIQATAAGMRWSLRRPYAVDLRSARATPAPPGVMVAYSVRLAVSTTFTCLIFAVLMEAATWPVPLVVGAALAAWSTARLARARRRWVEPTGRARVVTTVAA